MPPTKPDTSAYLRTKVLTARPEELRLMLLDGAIKFLTQGRDGLIRKDFEASFTGLSQCRNILLELTNSTRPDVAPELCERVTALYTYMYTQLVDASMEKDPAKADRVLALLEYERQTWVMAMEKAKAENSDEAQTAAPAPQTPAPRLPLSVHA